MPCAVGLFLAFLCAFYPLNALAQAPKKGTEKTSSEVESKPLQTDLKEFEGLLIHRVRIKGLERTHPKVVEGENLLTEGKPFSALEYEESLQRIKNLRIFSVVKGQISRTAQGIELDWEVEEKLTTIPFFLIGGGGGTFSVKVGFFDINTFGWLLEMGGWYEFKSKNHSVGLWYRDPHFLGSRLLLKLDAGSLGSDKSLYGNEQKLEGAYYVRRSYFHAGLEKEVASKLKFGLGVEALGQNFGEVGLSNEQIEATLLGVHARPVDSRYLLVKSNLNVGQLNSHNYMQEGVLATLCYEKAVIATGAKDAFQKMCLKTLGSLVLPWEQNITARMGLSISDATELENQAYLGGFEQVRGLLDNELRGKTSLFGNAEYRVAGLKYKSVILQHAFFYDVGSTGQNIQKTFDNKAAQSIGLGLRLIPTKIHLVALRLDYAFLLTPRKGGGLSFGMLQFF